jgi:hypothetical protein
MPARGEKKTANGQRRHEKKTPDRVDGKNPRAVVGVPTRVEQNLDCRRDDLARLKANRARVSCQGRVVLSTDD